jgi:hypothetical protein
MYIHKDETKERKSRYRVEKEIENKIKRICMGATSA